MTNQVNLFGIGVKSKSSNLTAAHRLNCFYDVQTDGDKTTVSAIGTPGLTLFATPSASQTYGMHWVETANRLFVFQGGALYSISPDGVVTTCFNAIGTDINNRVSMANNGTDLIIATGTYVVSYNVVTGMLTNISPLIPYDGQKADTVTFLDGRFIINRPGTGQFYISGIYDAQSWNGLDFATAESNPDNLLAVIADKGLLVLFGSSSVEFWQDNGDVLFPFSRVNATPTESGLAARWSISKCQGLLTGLFRNKQGMLAVCMIDGYQVTPISNDDMNYIINSYSHIDDAVGFGYSLNGKFFYQISFPTEGKTWLYEAGSRGWSQLQSEGYGRHLADIGVSFGRKFIVSDFRNGSLYFIDPSNYTDNDNPIAREITGSHVFANSRNKMTISRLRVDLEGGVGINDGQGSDPKIMLQVSRDNGHTWGFQLWTNLGKIGEYMSRAEWRRLGLSRDWLFRIRVTDPVKFVIIAAIIEGQELNK
jgi:hypothetical protein